MSGLPKVALIAGPTASGKSALALALAERQDGVIINADASQVYADLRVLTARPSPEEEAQAPHRLFGHVDGADTGYSAARWAGEARGEIAAAQAAGRLPILVGGTGLYLRTLIDGIAPVPGIDPVVRAAVRAMPVAEAHARLGDVDPPAAARLNPADTTRVSRALEVALSTGRPLSAWQAERVGGIGGVVNVVGTILLPDRAWLAARCDARLEAMFAHAVPEVSALMARTDIAQDAPVRRAIGVAEVADWQTGLLSRDAALKRAQIATRQYAKRQYTWFRNQPPVDWIQIDETQKIDYDRVIETRLRI